MSSAQYIFEWLAILFVIVGLFLAFIRARDYWASRFYHRTIEPQDLPEPTHSHTYIATRFSLRRLK
jgi:hypothetical protein